ncbi:MAG: YkgJ family cysteine cluster protein [Thermovirgaceae bacterium]|nr:YkgJ family cysteine cluster protein [Thermovirgaceae bacterium]
MLRWGPARPLRILTNSGPAVHLSGHPEGATRESGSVFFDPALLRKIEKHGVYELEYEPWWSNGLLFSCLGCGRCCRGEPGAIWVNEVNIEAASALIELDPADFRKIFVTGRWERPSLREKPNGDCVMYERESARCKIYVVRPAQCSLFPFWPSILKSPGKWERASAVCPGIGDGRLYTAEEIAALLEQSPFPDL